MGNWLIFTKIFTKKHFYGNLTDSHHTGDDSYQWRYAIFRKKSLRICEKCFGHCHDIRAASLKLYFGNLRSVYLLAWFSLILSYMVLSVSFLYALHVKNQKVYKGILFERKLNSLKYFSKAIFLSVSVLKAIFMQNVCHKRVINKNIEQFSTRCYVCK